MFLPTPLKKISILVEKIPWVAAQYLRAASHVPTGTAGMVDLTPSSPAGAKRPDPAIPIPGATQCPRNRDGRDKPAMTLLDWEPG